MYKYDGSAVEPGIKLAKIRDDKVLLRYKIVVVAYIIVTIFFIAIDWVRFDLSLLINNSGFDLLFNILLIGALALYLCLSMFSIIYLCIKWKTIKIKAVVPLMLMLCVSLYYMFINYSATYIDINYYYFNKNIRNKIVSMYENDELTKIGINRYLVPYRLFSHNKKVYGQKKDGVTIVIFFISNGFNSDRILFYVSDDSKAYINRFGEYPNYWQLDKIKKMDDNWYCATIKH